MGSGFDNDVMYADNVDFTGGSPVSGKVTASGQLLIGAAVAPFIRVNTLTAGTGITITNGPGTITVGLSGSATDLHTARFIVGILAKGANYTTITAALAAAVSGDTIFIQTGTYTEDLTLKDGVNMTAFNCDALTPNVIIVGTCTASFTGTASYSGIQFKTNGAAAILVTGANAIVVNMTNCFITGPDATPIVMDASVDGRIEFTACRITSAGLNFQCTNATGMAFYNCIVSGTISTFNSSGGLVIARSTWNGGIATSGAGSFSATTSTFIIDDIALNIGTEAANEISHCVLHSGSSASIYIVTACVVTDCLIDSDFPNAVDGEVDGILTYGNLTFAGTGSFINTGVQIALVHSNDAIEVILPAVYPYQIATQDELIAVNADEARTITLTATPVIGEKHTIKDIAGGAATFNITIDGNGNNIDGISSQTISTNYGSLTVVFTTEWSII